MTLPSYDFGTKTSFPQDYEVTKSTTLQMTSMEGGNNKFYVLELHEA